MNFHIAVDKDSFLESAGKGSVRPIFTEIPYASPATIYPRFHGRNTLLLESVKGPWNIARYSFMCFEPYSELKMRDTLVEISTGGKKTVSSRRPLEKLKEMVSSYPQELEPALPPFQGGAAGLLSYDFVHYLEKLPRTVTDDLRIPDAHFLLFDKLISFDHMKRKAWAVVCPGAMQSALGYRQNAPTDWASEYEKAVDALNGIAARASATMPSAIIGEAAPPAPIELVHEMSQDGYMDIVKKAKAYIKAGDIFQANLSQRVHSFIGETSPWEIYLKLRSINPSPFAAFADFGEYQIASSSPERLIKVNGEYAETRPIAGTRPRGRDTSEDKAMRAELLLNDKERAEHIMLIDLERNDLGRVCDYGSINVDELMITEDYSHVIHIVSNIKGRLAPGRDMFDAVKATFPGGTITGVPKVRCMEIIDELEPVARGPYTGSLGYFGFNGQMDMNIIIRTFVIKNGIAYVQAGAGIVADSDPEREYHETLRKAEALIMTLRNLGK